LWSEKPKRVTANAGYNLFSGLSLIVDPSVHVTFIAYKKIYGIKIKRRFFAVD
jgi:hypothetical protein